MKTETHIKNKKINLILIHLIKSLNKALRAK